MAAPMTRTTLSKKDVKFKIIAIISIIASIAMLILPALIIDFSGSSDLLDLSHAMEELFGAVKPRIYVNMNTCFGFLGGMLFPYLPLFGILLFIITVSAFLSTYGAFKESRIFTLISSIAGIITTAISFIVIFIARSKIVSMITYKLDSVFYKYAPNHENEWGELIEKVNSSVPNAINLIGIALWIALAAFITSIIISAFSQNK